VFLWNVPGTVEEVKRRLRKTWEARDELTVWPTVDQLVAEKYGRAAWVRRR
jgi:hypothetical protein